MCVFLFVGVCGNREKCAVTCGNMITYMVLSGFYVNIMCIVILKGGAGFILIYSPCIITWSPPESFLLIMTCMSTFVYVLKTKNDQNKSNNQHHMI